MTGAAFAQTPADLKARCNQLTKFYDYYGANSSSTSDGARNQTRIAAGLDCANGRYAEGIASMEALLKAKNFDVPPQPTGIAQQPSGSAQPTHRLQQWR